jgi:hypothetical protein
MHFRDWANRGLESTARKMSGWRKMKEREEEKKKKERQEKEEVPTTLDTYFIKNNVNYK